MLKQIAWNTFKNTGDINTFMELTKVDEVMNMAKDTNEKLNINNKNENAQENTNFVKL